MPVLGDQQGTLRSNSGLDDEHKKKNWQTLASSSDADLMQRLAGGDRRAFETLFLDHRQDLLNFIHKRYLSLDDHAAEDVVGETFLRLWFRRHSLLITRNIRNYLMSVARSVVADRYEGQLAADGKLSADTQSSGLSPHAVMAQDEIAQQVARAVDSLAESHRLAMELRQTGSSAKQIAAISNCTEKAAQRRVEKAREQLRLNLSHCGPSCVMDAPRLGRCPAQAKELFCLKWLYSQQLRS
jgi:RNA polymerase sigma-70 factor (ECF subfamily)